MGWKVLVLNLEDGKDRRLSAQLREAISTASKRAFQEGLFADKPNEASDRIEPFVREALNEVGLTSDSPETRSGKKKAAGYPDLRVVDEWGRVIYMDCKTYSRETKGQSFRTFYFSPSDDPKITQDAFHLLVSFELERAERAGQAAFVPISWQIYTLDKLLVRVKHEFNASNEDLYRPEALLASGEIPGRP